MPVNMETALLREVEPDELCELIRRAAILLGNAYGGSNVGLPFQWPQSRDEWLSIARAALSRTTKDGE